MRTKDFAKVAHCLLPSMPGFTLKGPMLFRVPVEHTLLGLYFDGSSFDAKAFYVWMFFLPAVVGEGF